MHSEKKAARRPGALLVLSAALLFTIGFESAGYQSVVLPVSEQFHFGAAGIGRIVSVQYFAVMVFSFFLGRLADRVGKKPALRLALLLFLAGCCVCLIPGPLALFAFGIFLTGGGYGSIEGLSNAALVDHDPARADQALNVTQFAFSIGAFVSPLACSAALRRGADWRFPFLVCGVLGLVLFAALRAVPFSRRPAAAPAGETRGVPAAGRPRGALFPVAASIFFYVGIEIGISYFNGVFFSDVLGKPAYAAYALSLFWLSMGASRLFFGLVRVRAERTILLCQFLLAAAIGLLTAVRSVWPALGLMAVIGAAAGPIWPLLVSTAVRSCPDASGATSGVMTLSSGLGGAVVPLLFGYLSETVSIRVSYWTLAGFSAAGFALMLLRRAKRRAAGREKTNAARKF